MTNELGDVWELETSDEKRAIEALGRIIDWALVGDSWAQDYLARLWGEDWEAVREKLETEGSAWYAWWMDGVREYLARIKKGEALFFEVEKAI